MDLEALNSKPFKDATQADSIRKLEQRLEGVAKGEQSREVVGIDSCKEPVFEI